MKWDKFFFEDNWFELFWERKLNNLVFVDADVLDE